MSSLYASVRACAILVRACVIQCRPCFHLYLLCGGQVLSTFPDMPAISFGVADAKAVPRATSAAGLEGLQTSQLVFFGSGAGQPPHAPVASVGDDKLHFEWAWLKGQALQAGCGTTAPAAAAHEKREL